MFDTLLSLDRDILIWSQGLIPKEYTHLIQLFGEIGVIWTAIALLSLWFSGRMRNDNGPKVVALQIFFTITLSYTFYTIVHLFFPPWRPNPQEVVDAVGALIPRPFDNSFPSGHGLFFGALMISLIRFYPKKSFLIQACIFSTLMVVSRVLVGVHYPLDIVGGIVLGGIGAYLLSFLTEHRIMRQYIYGPIITLLHFIKL